MLRTKLIKNYSAIITALISLAIPIMLGGLINRIPGFVTAIMVARLGAKELAASSLITALLLSFIIILYSLFFPVSIFVGRAFAAGKNEEVGSIFQQSCFLSILVGIPVMVIVWNLAQLLKWLHQSPELITLVESYLHAYAWGIIPMLSFFCCEQFAIGISRSYLIFIWSIINIVAVIIPGYGMLYGKWGFPRLGMSGVAYSTSFAYWLNFIVALTTFALSQKYKVYNLFKFRLYQQKFFYLKKILKVGWPISILYIIELSTLFLITVFIGWINSAALGAQQIAMQLELIALIFISGISFASGVLISQAIGRNDYSNIWNIGVISLLFCISIMLVIGLCYIEFPIQLASIYIDVKIPTNAAILDYTKALLPISALLQIFAATYNVLLASLRGFHDTKLPMYIVAIISLCISLPLAYYLGFYFKLDAVGIKLGVTIGYLIMGLLLSWRFWLKSHMLIAQYLKK